jgi:micrococcal nuclease
MRLPNKRNTRLIITLLLLLLSSYSFITTPLPNKKQAAPSASPSTVLSRQQNKIVPTITLTLGATTTATYEAELVTVARVVDGDTIVLEDKRKLRYIGINSPESVDPRRPVQCFGEEASEYNKSLVEGQTVRLEKDVSETDKYGRLLRYVYINDQMVNELLVSQGYAHASSYPPDVKHQKQLKQAENDARMNKRGLWEKCPQ